jgi:hypothetical protein
MDSKKPLLASRAGSRGNFRYGQRRSIGRKNRILWSNKVEIGKQLLLETDVFDNGLDDQVSSSGSLLPTCSQSNIVQRPTDERLLSSLILGMGFFRYCGERLRNNILA